MEVLFIIFLSVILLPLIVLIFVEALARLFKMFSLIIPRKWKKKIGTQFNYFNPYDSLYHKK